MGSIYGISCSNCDFNIILEGIDCFYVDHNTDELIEYILLMSTRIDEDNKMAGYIERTYCPDCDKLIKTYIIRESKYSEEESISKLEEIIKKSDINDKEQIEFYADFEGEEPNEFINKFLNKENILSIVCFEPFDEDSFYYKDINHDIRINCPQCDKELFRNFKAEKCPVCESELLYGLSAMLD